jgi:hypothetical protein
MKIAKQLLILILLLAGVFGTTSGQAATLLSNMGIVTEGGYGGSPDSAQHFTTGSQAMNVTSIDLSWQWLEASPGVYRVGIYTDHAGKPSTRLVGSFFTNPNPTSLGTMTYSGNVILAANTTYWTVVDISDYSEVAYTFDYNFVVDSSTEGAVILPRSANGNNVAGTWKSDRANLKFALKGSSVAPTPTPVPIIGIYSKSTGIWYLDLNGNMSWDGPSVDAVIGWGGDPSDIPVVGDWNGSGTTKIGVYRQSTGTWYLDLNGNRVWDGLGVDALIAWGGDPSDKPVVGDWNGSGTSKIGVYRESTGTWYLDLNDNQMWDGCGTDACIGWGGVPGDEPVVGTW